MTAIPGCFKAPMERIRIQQGSGASPTEST